MSETVLDVIEKIIRKLSAKKPVNTENKFCSEKVCDRNIISVLKQFLV